MDALVMETLSTFGVRVLCVSLGLMVVILFFKKVNLSDPPQQSTKPDSLTIQGLITPDTWLTVHTSDSRTFEHVRFVGCTNSETYKSAVPYDLTGLVILEDAEKQRFLVRSSLISMIVVKPEQPEQPVSAT